MRHEHERPCPITGEQIPEDFIWTDHERKGVLNACSACNDNLPMTLQELQEKRIEEDNKEKRTRP